MTIDACRRRRAASTTKGRRTTSAPRAASSSFDANPERFLNPDPAQPRRRSISKPSTRARCTRRCVRRAPARARSAAWRSSRSTVTRRGAANPELDDMTRRFCVALVLTLPILVLHDCASSAGAAARSRRLARRCATGSSSRWRRRSCCWGGWPFFVRGWASIVNRHLNMFTLIALGVGAAYAYSVVATLAPGLFPDSFRMARRRSAVYFEPAAVIVVLVLLGQVLELRARSRTGAAIRALLGLAPKTARRVEADGSEAGRAARARARRRSAARAARRARAGRRRRPRRARARSTNRWSPASRFRSRRRRSDR